MTDFLMVMTADLPCRIIALNGRPYLERYFVGQNPDGSQVWLHHFLTADSERHLHTHPWRATSTVLSGGYHEERARMNKGRVHNAYGPGKVNHIDYGTLHRITEVKPDTWTLMVVEPHWGDHWFFIGEDGDMERVPKSHGDHLTPWWENYDTRFREHQQYENKKPREELAATTD